MKAPGEKPVVLCNGRLVTSCDASTKRTNTSRLMSLNTRKRLPVLFESDTKIVLENTIAISA
jgi:hypothetical protein